METKAKREHSVRLNQNSRDERHRRVIRKRALLRRQMDDDTISASEIDKRVVTAYNGIYNRKIKRMIDIVLASILTVAVAPVCIMVAIAIFLEDGFPILYRAQRGGYKGKPFRICKFRSMIKNAERAGGGTTELHDKRITKVGSVIRKMKVDEVPNLLNVLSGDMSFIGPRPELSYYTDQYKGTEKLIFEVRPGMTDYSSIEFINMDEIVGQGNADEMYEQKVLPKKNKLRVKYAATVSFSTDVKLFVKTVWKVLEKCYRYTVKHEHR